MIGAYGIKVSLGLAENVLQFRQFQRILLEHFVVGVDLPQLAVQFVQRSLQIDHLFGMRSWRELFDLVDPQFLLLDFRLQVAQFAFHFVAAAHLFGERSLEGRQSGVQLNFNSIQFKVIKLNQI